MASAARPPRVLATVRMQINSGFLACWEVDSKLVLYQSLWEGLLLERADHMDAKDSGWPLVLFEKNTSAGQERDPAPGRGSH